MNYALIFAGGCGNRMNTCSKPKQFLQLYGKEIIVYTIENFQNHHEIDAIAVVCLEQWIPFLKRLIVKHELDKVQWIIPGGETGQKSIFNGLEVLHQHNKDEQSVVLIHDGVRPFVNDDLISKCITAVKKYGSAITVVPAIETVVSLNKDRVSNIIDRSKCFHAKAPQCFLLEKIYDNHLKANNEGLNNMIDSASLMNYYGETLHTVLGNFDNIKITTPADFYIFRALHDVRENQQIFDIY